MTTIRAENDVEDAINRYIRHCRIGKVTMKRWVQPVIPAIPYVGDFPHYPPASPSIWPPNTALPIALWQNPVVSTC